MENLVLGVAKHFGFEGISIESLTEGLIHKTYKAIASDGHAIILQQVNTSIFTNPQAIVDNYELVFHHLQKHNGLRIPKMIRGLGEKYLYEVDSSCWRVFEYITDSYTENLPTTRENIFNAAQCYGTFVRNLFELDIRKLSPTIPGFHDLNSRFYQFLLALQTGNPARIKQSAELISKVKERKYQIDFYNRLIGNADYKLRAMHHDCKLSNILFHTGTKKAICPIDLDTVMPGYFFSDVGDMIRAMVSDSGEDSPLEKIIIQKDFYEAILTGYQSGIGDEFTKTELDHIHHAGLIMIYMQAIRFLNDYLLNDVYYKISYPHQNFKRAANQLALLEKLENFLESDYKYQIR